MLKYSLVLTLFLMNSLYAAETTQLQLKSTDKRNVLVELFTSEGCSSCPPAEEFLNSLKNTDDLWNTYVPVAFHVDYWDYIGWKDPYATKNFGYRQSHYAKLKRASTVYTPAFMVNGNSWRKGIFSRSLPTENSNVGTLDVAISDDTVHAKFKPLKNVQVAAKLNIAVLGMNLTSHIQRGENEGRTARHEFVVVGFKSVDNTNGKYEWQSSLPRLHYKGAKEYAVAIWVSEKNNPTPIQVVGGLLPGFKTK